MGECDSKTMSHYVPSAQFHPMHHETITEHRAPADNRWSRQGSTSVREGWWSGGSGIGMSYVRVGQRIIACGRGSDWGPNQRPRAPESNYWAERQRRGYEWEPAKPRVRSGPTQEELDNLVKKQIAFTMNDCSDLEKEIAEYERLIANDRRAGIEQNFGLGPEYAFGERLYQCKIEAPGIAYRHVPSYASKNTTGCGPVFPEHVIADRICQGARAVFVRDVRTKEWLPLSAPDDDARQTLQHKGRKEANDLSKITMSAGANKLVKEKDAWFTPKQN